MKKHLVGIILLAIGVLLMITGIFMQFVTNEKKKTSENNTNTSINQKDELHDVSTFNFNDILSKVLTGQASGYLIECKNDANITYLVDLTKINSLFDKVKSAKGYRSSDKVIDNCPVSSFVVQSLNQDDNSKKIMEIQIFDKNTLLISDFEVTYEFVFDEDVSMLLSNLS